MASSTTMPIASTSASSEMVLAEKPSASSTAKVPIRLTGTAISGMSVARRLPRNRKTTITTSTKASISVWITSSIVSLDEGGRVVDDLVGAARRGSAARSSVHGVLDRLGGRRRALAPGAW